MIRHRLRNHISDFWICLFYWETQPVDKQSYKFFSLGLASLTSKKKLIALFVDRSRPIKQANPKFLDYISQTMVYYPIKNIPCKMLINKAVIKKHYSVKKYDKPLLS